MSLGTSERPSGNDWMSAWLERKATDATASGRLADPVRTMGWRSIIAATGEDKKELPPSLYPRTPRIEWKKARWRLGGCLLGGSLSSPNDLHHCVPI